MRIALISDTHLGITRDGKIKEMLNDLKQKHEFDVLVHAGDYSGSCNGHTMVKETVEIIRSVFPDKPYLSVLGNHDFWSARGYNTSVSPDEFNDNYLKILEVFKTHNVHFLDEDGIYTHPVYPEIKIFGNSGWYNNPNPPTNDCNFLPRGLDGDTNRYLLKRAHKLLEDAVHGYIWRPEDKTVFVSHFPVIKRGNDYKGAFEDFSWSESLGESIQQRFMTKYFLEGHSHMFHNGPLKYNCGPDYYYPTSLIIDIT